MNQLNNESIRVEDDVKGKFVRNMVGRTIGLTDDVESNNGQNNNRMPTKNRENTQVAEKLILRDTERK